MSDIAQRLEFACDTARKAGQLAFGYFSNLSSLTVVSKGIQDMASEADVNTENLIRAAIAKQYPNDDFFGEESSDTYQAKQGCGVWVVDPIDGTQPFINGIRSWCISISYIENDQIIIGVIYDPCADEMFAASLGHGATLNGKPMKTSAAKSVAEGLISIGYSNRVTPAATLDPLKRLMMQQGMFHRSGSGALSLAYVAAGRLLGYFEPHMNIWDCAAGMLLITEAGGQTYDCLQTDNYLISGSVVIGAADGVYAQLLNIVEG
ncbi:inositol monophosphatase family protein [Aliiglaciecola lipolytica]|uniref:Inositol-1-monophosphatase n=1 Tax=Aliiglaciecola lipolytica E3 TaxID=1127673 RepID=K6Y6R9_9ALTE|nr:inositol monophosphatase [Aliiglaciecola lipolytica]GAC13912.1 myo-inositol-1(or 4)-monophosphatase [Aliiglaciecola lipolytica E3]